MTNKEIKKQRKQKYKEYKKQLNSEIFDLDNELVYNDKAEALIECKIGKAENIFNKFDLAKYRTITDEFEDYLMSEVELVPVTENIAIQMTVDENFTEENEKQVKKAMKNHFGFKITSDKVKTKRNNILSTVFITLGTLFIILSAFIGVWLKDSYIPAYETCLVLAWFFLWEGISMISFDGMKLKKHCYNMVRLYNANISFVRFSPNQTPTKVDEKNQNNNIITLAEKSDSSSTKKKSSKFNLFSIFRKK